MNHCLNPRRRNCYEISQEDEQEIIQEELHQEREKQAGKLPTNPDEGRNPDVEWDNPGWYPYNDPDWTKGPTRVGPFSSKKGLI